MGKKLKLWIRDGQGAVVEMRQYPCMAYYKELEDIAYRLFEMLKPYEGNLVVWITVGKEVHLELKAHRGAAVR